MNDYRLYILMRNDLQSMSPGRCMAQASHATSVLEHEFGEGSKCHRPDVREWKKQTKQGFGTCIVLAASKEKIEEIFSHKELKRWIVKGWVTDPDYVIRVSHEVAGLLHQGYDARYCDFRFDYTLADEKTTAITRAEKTCAFILGTKEELEPHLGELPLY
jgi:hypothetical protein